MSSEPNLTLSLMSSDPNVTGSLISSEPNSTRSLMSSDPNVTGSMISSEPKVTQFPDMVIREIVEYLDKNDLAKLRSINQQWKSHANSVLDDKMDGIQIVLDPKVTVKSQGQKSLLLDIIPKSDLVWTNFSFNSFPLGSTFAKTLLEIIGPGMTKLTLKYEDEEASTQITTKQLANLLQNQAPFLEELDIFEIPYSISNSVLFPVNTPQLELRKISFTSDQLSMGAAYSHKFLKSLFKASPKLESLILYTPPGILWPNSIGYDILNRFAEYGNVGYLQVLDIECTLDISVATLLTNKFAEAPLKKFITHLIDEKLSVKLLSKVLDSMKETLETLELNFPYIRLSTLPMMPNLQELAIYSLCDPGRYWESNSDDDDDEFQPLCLFTWGTQFPNLVKLNLYDYGSKYADGFEVLCALWDSEDATPCLTLKNLRLPPQLSGKTMGNIGKLFPNVLKLILPVQTKIGVFTKLWTNWPGLKSLVLSTHYFDMAQDFDDSETESDSSDEDGDAPKNGTKPNDKLRRVREVEKRSFDSILTGISDESLKAIRKSGKNGRPFFSDEEIEAMKIHPSISDLKELNHLLFDCGFRKWSLERTKLTDVTLRDLKKMKALTSLLFPKDAVAFTDPGIRDLCDTLNLKNSLGGRDSDSQVNRFLYFVKYDWQMKKFEKGEDIIDKTLPDYK